jgi:NAD(P)-dependent dehydrogenase (short-subunit alcohol dehydrogenase family)
MKKVALVTGAYQGIGRATCERLMAQDFHVIMADIQSCEYLAADYRTKGFSATNMRLDLAKSSIFPAIANSIEQQFGKLDVLINNAAILPDMGQHPSDLAEAVYRHVLEVNQIGPFLLTKALVPLLKKAPSARIVNVSSQVAQLAQLSDMNSPIKDDVCAAYQASKIGVNGNTVLFAKELEPLGIKVNSYCPGWVDTAMNTEELPDYGEEVRPKTPYEGADTAIWLATLDSNGPTAGFFTDRDALNW